MSPAEEGVLAELSWADDVDETEGKKVGVDVTGIVVDDVVTKVSSLELAKSDEEKGSSEYEETATDTSVVMETKSVTNDDGDEP